MAPRPWHFHCLCLERVQALGRCRLTSRAPSSFTRLTENITHSAAGRLRSVCLWALDRSWANPRAECGFVRSSNCPEPHPSPREVTEALGIAKLVRLSTPGISTTSFQRNIVNLAVPQKADNWCESTCLERSILAGNGCPSVRDPPWSPLLHIHLQNRCGPGEVFGKYADNQSCFDVLFRSYSSTLLFMRTLIDRQFDARGATSEDFRRLEDDGLAH
ncbi:hypothetical protein BDY19DRAFT_738469 [Irpex rosettiformis]|uniref:Uncharacterized protein n=1 Tax=Irpex rosettiformis TaxID=378272 RepID=A0ACB8U9A4_9APHY|nr:hypothetical protein BDY19DRAFT_738469 [Irpex rosettiformis]